MGGSTRDRLRDMKERAYRACGDLLETAGWLGGQMSRELETFHLTIREFRTLEMLANQGPTYLRVIAQKLGCSTTNMSLMVKRLERQGWVRREESSLPPVVGGREKGRRIVVVSLTPEGRKVSADVLPKQRKVVMARMRVLNGREQDTLSHLCRKLRKGDVLKFLREIMLEDVDEGD